MIKTEESVRPIVAKRLSELMEMSGVTNETLSKATNVGISTIVQMKGGRYPMHADILCKVADYFAVPTDYILGRCELGKTYKADMKKLYEESYEKYLKVKLKRGKKIENDQSAIESTYPYNLLEAIYVTDPLGITEFVPLSDEQLEGLNYAVTNTLTEREQHFIKRHFEEYATLDDIANEEHIGRERVRQIIARALRKLRHPSRFNYIRYGINAAKINIYMKELERKKEQIEELEAYIEAHKDLFKPKEVPDNLPSVSNNLPYGFVLDDLNLSVRSYNCMVRSAVYNGYELADLRGSMPVSYVEDLFVDDKILKVRNLGQKSLYEIANRLKELGSTSKWVLKWVS